MKRCPMCSANAWPADTFGKHVCPNCKTPFKLTQTGIKPDVSFRQLRDRPKANRDTTIVNGKVLCACCRAPFDLADTIDGELSTDGTRRIDVQIGWTLRGHDFVPAYQERVIPRTVRGLLCVTCMTYGNGRPVGRSVASGGIMARTYQSERVESVIADVKSNGYRSERDPDPTWAHTNDPSWLRPQVEIPHYDYTDRWVFRRSFYRGPLCWTRAVTGVKPLRVFPFEPTLNRSPRSHYFTAYRFYNRQHVAPTDLSEATRLCIVNGWADLAATYARLAAHNVRSYPV